MNKASTNFLVDAIAFVAFLFLTATGVLIRYVLPPGSGHFSTLWGMDRHGWGQIHFWIAVVLLSSLALHLVLHWRLIACMVQGRPREGSIIRVALAFIGILALCGLAIVPFFAQVEQAGEPPHKLQSPELEDRELYKIDGSITLLEVEQRSGVPTAVILQDLGLPQNLPLNERLGRLHHQYGFEMEDVRKIVHKRADKR
jgi:hypothetical protein